MAQAKRAPAGGPLGALLYADSETNADQLYFSRFFAPDPFLAFAKGRTRLGVLSMLEFGRGQREAGLDVILPLEDCAQRARAAFAVPRAGPAEIAALLAREYRLPGYRVAADFPAGVLRRLEELRVRVEVAEGPLFPAREVKEPWEVEAVVEGNRVAALGLAAAEKLLRAARVRGGALVHGGRALTSERVREEVEIACLRAGGVAARTIVAGGDQACDPHCRGSGPLRAGEFVIIDVFPRMPATGYHGDMTRTFLKGRASDAQRKLWETVRTAQQAALGAIRAGTTGRAVHRAVEAVFRGAGYATTRDGPSPTGFIHGTGHGLGLAVHEPPRLNPTGPRLRAGMVVTVEPGLYYPGLGGVRTEDVVMVEPDGHRMLSAHPYDWELA